MRARAGLSVTIHPPERLDDACARAVGLSYGRCISADGFLSKLREKTHKSDPVFSEALNQIDVRAQELLLRKLLSLLIQWATGRGAIGNGLEQAKELFGGSFDEVEDEALRTLCGNLVAVVSEFDALFDQELQAHWFAVLSHVEFEFAIS